MKRVTRQCHKTLSTTVKWNENIVTTSHCVSTTDLSKWHFLRHHINNQSSLTTVVSFTQHLLTLYTSVFSQWRSVLYSYLFPISAYFKLLQAIRQSVEFHDYYFRNLLLSENLHNVLVTKYFPMINIDCRFAPSFFGLYWGTMNIIWSATESWKYPVWHEQLARDSSFRCRHRLTRIRSLFNTLYTSIIGIIALTR